jgi:glycosyltransferase involved in cell wall biosynthesis
MNAPTRLLVLLTLAFCGARAAVAVEAPAKKIIYYGWSTRDSAYYRNHWAEMERIPFDGIAISIAIDRTRATTGDGSTGNLLGWQVFGKTAFQLSDFQPAIADLQVPEGQHFTDNFLPLSIATRDQDQGLSWFDDARWATIEGNWRVFVSIAKDGGCRGLMLDPEHYDYECELFNYTTHRAQRFDATYAQYVAKARARGRQLGIATAGIFPDITIALLYGYSLSRDGLRKGAPLEGGRYALLPAFLDGLIEGSAPAARFVDLWEQGHHQRSLPEFKSARQEMQGNATMAANPAVYWAKVKPGLSLRIDYEPPHVAWDARFPNRNFFSPARFQAALAAAVKTTDRYVWIYSEEGPQFFPPARLPAGYLTAIRAAKTQAVRSTAVPMAVGVGGTLGLVLTVPFLRRRKPVAADRRLRILMVTGIFPPDRGGPASYTPKMATALTGFGHSVSVICLSDSLHHDDRAYPFAVQRIRRRQFWPLRILKVTLAIWRAGRQHDLVYVNGLGAESALGAFLANRPAVHKVVGDYAWERVVGWGKFHGTLDEYQAARKPPLLWLADLIRTVPLKLAESIIVPSAYLKRIVSGWKIAGEKVQVIRNAVQRSTAKEGSILLPRWEGKTIITVCRLVPWKGVDAVIRLLPELPETRFIIAGDGHDRRSLQALAQSLGVSARVLFLGDVPHSCVHQCLAQSDAFVLNSTYEGLPHVVLEAMAAQVPVIATNAGGTGEVVEHMVTGMLVRVGDSAGLKAAIERLWSDPELGRRLVAEATLRCAAHFDFDSMVAATDAVLRRALSPPPEPALHIAEVGS